MPLDGHRIENVKKRQPLKKIGGAVAVGAGFLSAAYFTGALSWFGFSGGFSWSALWSLLRGLLGI